MLQPQMQQAHATRLQFRQAGKQLVGYQVKARGLARRVIRVCCHIQFSAHRPRILARSGKKQSVEYAYMPVRHSHPEKCRVSAIIHATTKTGIPAS